MRRIAVFASGEGTGLQSLIDGRTGAEIALVVSSNPRSGSLRRAREAGIEGLCIPPGPGQSARLAEECKKRSVDLVCLSGFLQLLGAPMLEAFPGRILNIHPALLPAFGGRGLYGRRVHEAVLRAGAKVSGCTVHFVDAEYDHGPIWAQAAVPVMEGDTPESLGARVLEAEHWLYPEALRRLAGGGAPALRALISVSDKTGLVEFARGLASLGAEIVSTSGTARALREAGVAVRPLETLTGFPEILDGRVKTLHPRVHGGILMRRSEEAHLRQAASCGIEPIDIVAVNLYPFAEASKAAAPFSREAVENIDVGGVALIRAAAKNFQDVGVLVSPSDYGPVFKELKETGGLCEGTRRRLSAAAFEHTAAYDSMIAEAWSRGDGGFPHRISLRLEKRRDLRYGENPHQRAALYGAGEPGFVQLQGKALSFNNLVDAFGTWEAVGEFSEPAAVIFKHATPSGAAVGAGLLEALERAWACDPVSAYGGAVAFNRTVEADAARALEKRFVEVIAAPGFTPEALELFKKKPNLRLAAMRPLAEAPLLRSLGREVLVCDPDRILLSGPLKTVTKRSPTAEEERALLFAWAVCKHVRSNAIVFSGAEASVGIGAGQMSRVDSVRLAGEKFAAFRRSNPSPRPLVLASDAFFPFRDGIDEAARLGATAVIEPGGSVRDAEAVAAADEHGLAMVFTGVRHFKH
jgi:phosphoribosylaminoimidazolecarboxamide formyltransferase/IMP cyclohydrolase